MRDYYLYAIVLEGCGFSNAAIELLQPNITNKTAEIFPIRQDVKETYKTKLIQTFPQIYLKRRNSNGSLLIGGYNDILNLYTLFRGKYLKEDVNKYLNEQTNINKKALLRIIELINSEVK